MGEILQTEESVRLYEYELYKPELDGDTLSHHGILGMHWGQRNGPPYPLSNAISTGRALKKKLKKSAAVRKAKKTRKAKAKEAKLQEKNRKTKEQIMKDRDVEAILKDIGNFSDNEIRTVLNRIGIENQLKEEVARQRRANQPKLKRALNKAAKTVGEGLSSGATRLLRNAADNAVGYTAKKTADAIKKNNKEAGEMLEQLIRQPGGGRNNKKKNKNRNQNNKHRRSN